MACANIVWTLPAICVISLLFLSLLLRRISCSRCIVLVNWRILIKSYHFSSFCNSFQKMLLFIMWTIFGKMFLLSLMNSLLSTLNTRKLAWKLMLIYSKFFQNFCSWLNQTNKRFWFQIEQPVILPYLYFLFLGSVVPRAWDFKIFGPFLMWCLMLLSFFHCFISGLEEGFLQGKKCHIY